MKSKLYKLGLVTFASASILVACGNDTQTQQPVTNDTTQTEETTETTQDTATEETTSQESTQGNDTNTSDQTDDSSGAANDQSPEGQGLESREFEVDLDAAVAIFDETFPGASVDSVDFSIDNGEPRYDFNGFDATNEYELEVNADTGETREQEQEADRDDEDQAIDFTAIISPQEAMQAALNYVGSGYVDDWDLSTDDGRAYYEIDIEGEEGDRDDDIRVNAETSEVTEN